MKICDLPFKGIHVCEGGDVRVCGWTYECIGNLFEEDLYSIWHGEKAEKVRESIRNGSFSCCNKVACQYCANDSCDDLSEEEFEKRAVVPDKPKIISNACDFICNHSCPSCRDKIFVGDKDYNDKISKISEMLLPYMNEAEMLLFSGNGDIFASPTSMEIFDKLDLVDDKCELMIQTNGVLFNQKMWEKIERFSKYSIQFTVTPNSFERQTYKYLSGGHDNLDKMIENLYFLRDLRKKNLIKKFDISIVVQDTNYKELPSFVKRCIEDFECDTVVIKPVYYWFALTPEQYWFKDILNPLHPYFNDYMEVLKDPILKHEKVYFWGAHDIHKAKEHPSYNYKRYFNTFRDIICQDDMIKKLENALLSQNIDKVALYGTNDMAKMLYNLLKQTKIEITAFIDRDATVEEFCGMHVTKFDEFKPDMTDVIIVTNYAYITNVTRDLKFRNYNGRIISMDDIIQK